MSKQRLSYLASVIQHMRTDYREHGMPNSLYIHKQVDFRTVGVSGIQIQSTLCRYTVPIRTSYKAEPEGFVAYWVAAIRYRYILEMT